MTSRIRRIVLAMYGGYHPTTKPARAVSMPVYYLASHGCYEAMDDMSDYIVWANDAITADLPLSPLAPGNYGMPCA
jgi:hypothetical protein